MLMALKKLSSKLSKKFITVFTLSLVVLSSSGITYAAASAPNQPQPPKIVTGTVSLLSTISNWLLLIIPVGVGAMLGIQALQKSMTDDQAVIAEKNKLMKNTLIAGAIAMTADGLAALILNFYQ